MDTLELVDIAVPIPSNSPRFGGPLNLTLTITPDIANGEIGFTSNTTVVVYEPEDNNSSTVTNTVTCKPKEFLTKDFAPPSFLGSQLLLRVYSSYMIILTISCASGEPPSETRWDGWAG